MQLTWRGWQVGLAYCDNTLKVIGVCEFLDGDQLCNLEAALVRIGARECVAVEDKAGGSKSVENKKVKEVLQRCDVVLTQRKSSDFNTKDIEQVLNVNYFACPTTRLRLCFNRIEIEIRISLQVQPALGFIGRLLAISYLPPSLPASVANYFPPPYRTCRVCSALKPASASCISRARKLWAPPLASSSISTCLQTKACMASLNCANSFSTHTI